MATKKGKRYEEIKKKIKEGKVYEPKEGLELLFETKSAKFVETVEVALRLGVNPKHADQQVRGTVVLPNGTGKNIKILAITQEDNIKVAEEAGADYVGGEEILQKVQNGWMDFDLIIATPDMMPKLGKFGKILGPKGLMPNPKSGTVTPNIADAIKEFKKGKLAFRVDKLGSIHAPIGKIDFSKDKIEENFKAFMNEIIKLKPESVKGQYVKSVTLSLTMGPGIKLDSLLVQKYLEENA